MKGAPMIQGTKSHKLALNKKMDKTSLPDGRPGSSALQKKESTMDKGKNINKWRRALKEEGVRKRKTSTMDKGKLDLSKNVKGDVGTWGDDSPAKKLTVVSKEKRQRAKESVKQAAKTVKKGVRKVIPTKERRQELRKEIPAKVKARVAKQEDIRLEKGKKRHDKIIKEDSYRGKQLRANRLKNYRKSGGRDAKKEGLREIDFVPEGPEKNRGRISRKVRKYMDSIKPSPNKKLREGERKTKKTTRGSKIEEKIGGKRYVTKYRKDDTIRKTKGEGYRTKHSKTGKLIQEKEGGKVLKELAPGQKVNKWHG